MLEKRGVVCELANPRVFDGIFWISLLHTYGVRSPVIRRLLECQGIGSGFLDEVQWVMYSVVNVGSVGSAAKILLRYVVSISFAILGVADMSGIGVVVGNLFEIVDSG